MKKYCLIFVHDREIDLPQFYDTYEEAYNAMKEELITQIQEHGDGLRDEWLDSNGNLRTERIDDMYTAASFCITYEEMWTQFLVETDAQIFEIDFSEHKWDARLVQQTK